MTLASFNRELKRYDKELRCRFSKEKNKYIIEHKVKDRRGLSLPIKWYKDNNTLKYYILPENSDKYIQYHDGYYGVIYTDSTDMRVIRSVISMDTGYNIKWLKKKEEEEELYNKQKDKMLEQKLSDYSNGIGSYVMNRGSRANSFLKDKTNELKRTKF